MRKLCAKCHKLAAYNTIMGLARPELRRDIRSFPYMGCVIFFRYVDQAVSALANHPRSS